MVSLLRRRAMMVQKSSDETFLCRNYSPNGESFVYTISGISLSAGDYIEISADLTDCSHTNENIISIGESIAGWRGNHFHCYYTKSSGVLQMNAMYGKYDRYNADIGTTNLVIRLDKDGIYYNGVLWDKTGTGFYYNLMSYLLTKTEIDVGSREGSTRFYGKYNYIKWGKST